MNGAGRRCSRAAHTPGASLVAPAASSESQVAREALSYTQLRYSHLMCVSMTELRPEPTEDAPAAQAEPVRRYGNSGRGVASVLRALKQPPGDPPGEPDPGATDAGPKEGAGS